MDDSRTFSIRNGYTKQKQIQLESVDQDLRNSIWNLIDIYIITNSYFKGGIDGPFPSSEFKIFSHGVWFGFFKEPIDEIPKNPIQARSFIRARFFSYSFEKLFDFIEYILKLNFTNKEKFRDNLNRILEKENSGYRVLSNNQICPITNEIEIAEISSAISEGKYAQPSKHIEKAAKLISDKENPDYENSIKESISAIESVASIITGLGKADLSKALAKLEEKGKLHTGLKSALNQLFGFTSSHGSIRHASISFEDSPISKNDAQFFLVSCSAFVNYIKSMDV